MIAVPEALREKLGPEGVQALVDLFNRAAASRSIADLGTRVARKLTVQSRWMVGLFVLQTGVLGGLLALFLRP